MVEEFLPTLGYQIKSGDFPIMAHQAMKSSYEALVDRLNRCPQGAPPSETLYAILKLLFSEQEAGLVAQLPVKAFTAEQAARLWKTDLRTAQKNLDALSSRAILLDTLRPDGVKTYVLPPPMAGFFEFSMMRLRGDIDQKLLAQLFYQYMNVEEDFIKSLFINGDMQLGRVYVQESALEPEVSLRVLDYERASYIVRSATHRAVGVCYCRHKMQHMDRVCDAPMDICLTFNGCAESLSRNGVARSIDVAEGLDLLQQARDLGLVQFGDNVRHQVNFICNCCGCCCEALVAARRFGFLNPVYTSNFLPVIDDALCNGCGKCVDACPVEAMNLISANDPHKPRRRVARLDMHLCLGCGVCIQSCPKKSLRLMERDERVITPVDSVHRIVWMAVERGKLQNLIFDNQVLASHRAMAAVLGAILKLPPVKRTLANHQIQSRYVERLIVWGEKELSH